jgi:hypothetical protein
VVFKGVWSMSETPLPHTASADVPEERAGHSDGRVRKRSHSGEKRAVSAFSPGHVTSRSELAATLVELSPEELAFVAALRAAGLALELSDTELTRAAQHVQGQSRASRRLDLLAAYYDTPSDPLASRRRRATDRWFLFEADHSLNASQLLERVLDVVPELHGTELERVGGPDGTLVLRAGEDVCALEDEHEDDAGEPTVSVCDLIRAINVLLERRFVRARLVGLIGDGAREGYLGLPSVTAAIGLSSADYLAAPDAEALLDLTGW